ncbi:hypothetical protein EVAR_85170_1 [Eumeta japonica]|uniref:MADF domain-containing protein n=1 Tax=Eumeta variegata TaxID=151549 RepID=A0A4C2A2F3_EUMVA|nr:hypothetical protein EVAR_85170_1 [Eumeta japonica]
MGSTSHTSQRQKENKRCLGRLSAKLNVPVKELKTKKEILMGTFRRHLKKKQESTRSGAGSDDIYEPIWFAYAAMESFLLPVYTTRNTINTETGPSTSQVSKEIFSDETSRQLDETFGDETIENIGMETSSPSPSPAIPIAKSRSTSAKKPRRCPAPDTTEQQMATAFGQLTNALGQRQSHPTPKEDDECDLYAKLLSTKLRELSKDERKLVMYEIDGIFVNKIKIKPTVIAATISTSMMSAMLGIDWRVATRVNTLFGEPGPPGCSPCCLPGCLPGCVALV